MNTSFLFLDTGSSMGTPVPTCRSSNPFNQRLRPSGLLKWGEQRFLVDAGPDFRQQALNFGVERLAGILLTHTHFDHVAGLDNETHIERKVFKKALNLSMIGYFGTAEVSLTMDDLF